MRGEARTTGGLAAPLVAWAVTRTVLLLYVFKVFVLPGGLDVTSDVSGIYHRWFTELSGGSFPLDDVTWQYPPAAALAILSPALLTGFGLLGYASAFFVLSCAADAAVCAMLLYATRARARTAGARRAGVWVWIAGVPLLGPTAYARFDLMVTALAVAALLAGARHPRAAGMLAGLGALVKVWPALLLLGTPRGRAGRGVWVSALVTAAVVAVGFTVTMPGALDFVTAQGSRGTEVESVGSLTLHAARHIGWEGRVLLNYGSMEFVGPHVRLVSNAALVLSVLGLGWLLLWRLHARAWTRSTPADAAFAAVLVFTTTSRVLSPQYMIWLVGLAAVCLTLRASRQTLPAVLVLAATGLTLLEFPIWFAHVVMSDGPGLVVLWARNTLLVIASVLACLQLWRSTVTTHTPRHAGARKDTGSDGDGGGGGEGDADGDEAVVSAPAPG
ncbi:glycosyltransferase family 87 protein [Streptomyces axinellae]|uniref:Glycosyltransferase family 87 protein n=1 Tax=Streptomyces axinellae TaxID=552788 RepID=A0ABN3PS78_9ACTN